MVIFDFSLVRGICRFSLFLCNSVVGSSAFVAAVQFTALYPVLPAPVQTSLLIDALDISAPCLCLFLDQPSSIWVYSLPHLSAHVSWKTFEVEDICVVKRKLIYLTVFCHSLFSPFPQLLLWYENFSQYLPAPKVSFVIPIILRIFLVSL